MLKSRETSKVPRDFSKVIAGGASKRNAPCRLCFWAALSVALIALSMLLDEAVAQWGVIPAGTPARRFAWWISKLGEGWVVALACNAAALGCFLAGRAAAARLIFLALAISLLTGLTATFCRALTGRTRPCADVAQGFYGVRHDSQWLVGKYKYSSFPSGHGATAIGLATAAWLVKRRYGMATAVYAVLVCWARLAQGSHHFSDMVAAAALGVSGAVLLFRWLAPWLEIWTLRLEKVRLGWLQSGASAGR